jgi:hypothetical protein
MCNTKVARNGRNKLLGANVFEECKVEDYLEFFSLQLTPLILTKLTKESRKKLFALLGVLNDQLVAKTFLVGERVTVADITLFALMQRLDSRSYNNLKSLKRWFETMQYKLDPSEVKKEKSSEEKKGKSLEEKKETSVSKKEELSTTKSEQIVDAQPSMTRKTIAVIGFVVLTVGCLIFGK